MKFQALIPKRSLFTWRKDDQDYHYSQIAQGEISRSVAFPTHVWKMPNICNHIIVWLFSHMCAFSHTYVSKSKHVWKKAPRCKYTNVFGFFQTCWVKVKHLPLPQVCILSCFGLHLFCSWVVFLSHSGCKTVKPSINVS